VGTIFLKKIEQAFPIEKQIEQKSKKNIIKALMV
jgi:hypothetical protein